MIGDPEKTDAHVRKGFMRWIALSHIWATPCHADVTHRCICVDGTCCPFSWARFDDGLPPRIQLPQTTTISTSVTSVPFFLGGALESFSFIQPLKLLRLLCRDAFNPPCQPWTVLAFANKCCLTIYVPLQAKVPVTLYVFSISRSRYRVFPLVNSPHTISSFRSRLCVVLVTALHMRGQGPSWTML